MNDVEIGQIKFSNHRPFVLIAGVNVIESETMVMQTAAEMVTVTEKLGIPLVFKASFDKANRTSYTSYRGPGLQDGLAILAKVKATFGLALITDIHSPEQALPVAEVCDILQIPAFLARQTDLIQAASATQKVLHVKKPQFAAPEDMVHIVQKCREAGNTRVLLCERGSCFGYHNLVVDMLGFDLMKQNGYPVTFDVTHSLQQPGGLGHSANGRGAQVWSLARSAMAQGLAGLFLETHPQPELAKCDGPCALPLSQLRPFLAQMKAIDDLVKSFVQEPLLGI